MSQIASVWNAVGATAHLIYATQLPTVKKYSLDGKYMYVYRLVKTQSTSHPPWKSDILMLYRIITHKNMPTETDYSTSFLL